MIPVSKSCFVHNLLFHQLFVYHVVYMCTGVYAKCVLVKKGRKVYMHFDAPPNNHQLHLHIKNSAYIFCFLCLMGYGKYRVDMLIKM